MAYDIRHSRFVCGVGLCLLCGLLLLSSCRTSKRNAAQEQQTVAVVAQDPAQKYFFLEANNQLRQKNYSAAYDLLEHAALIDPNSPDLLIGQATYRFFLGDDSTGIEMLQQAVDLDTTYIPAKQALVNVYMQNNDMEAALPHLETLARLRPKNSEQLSQLATAYIDLNMYEDAIKTLDRIEVLEGKMSSLSFRKYSLYKALKKDKKAYEELESLSKEYPHEMSYRLAIGDQLLEDDRIDEARKVFDQVRRLEPDNEMLKLSMLSLYRKTGEQQLLAEMQDSILYGEHTSPELRASLMRDIVASEMHGDSVDKVHIDSMFRRLDEAFPRELEMLKLRAAYFAAYDSENDSDFVDIMDRVLELEPENTQALFYLLQYYAEHRNFERLENICRRGVLTHPDELLCHFYLGVAFYQQDKKAEALAALQEGILQKTENSRPAMVSELYSIMGDILHEMERVDEAFAAYDSSLVYQNDNASCLNNFAYYLSLREDQLDRAEEMSYRSIRLEPNNKTFLDTYAWILFVKGRYSEAKIYMDRVCPPDEADSVLLDDQYISGVVFEHAGDIAAMNGQMDEAVRFWTLAQQSGGTGLSAVLPRKIKQKKYIKE